MTIMDLFGKNNSVARTSDLTPEIEINETKIKKAEQAAELKGILKFAMDQKLPYVIIKLDRKFFYIDTDIQTIERTDRDYGYLVNNWDERKCLPIVGVPHWEEGVVSIVDGNGRIVASAIVDAEKYQYMYVLVILDAPQEPKARKKYEAQVFIEQNNIKIVTPLQKHGSNTVLEDEATIALNNAMKKYNVFFGNKHGGFRSENTIGSYVQVYKIAKLHGQEGLEWVFDLLLKAGFDRKPNGYSKYIIKAINDLYTLYPERRDEIKELMSDYLRDYNPSGVKANAITAYPRLFEVTATSMFLEDVYTWLAGIKDKRRIVDENTNRVKVRKAI